MAAPTTAYYPNPQPPPRKRNTRLIVGVVVLVGGLLGAGFALLLPGTPSDAVYLNAASSDGTNPFLVGGVTTPAPTTAANAPMPPVLSRGANGAPPEYAGTAPGLYGGTQGASTCNTDQITTYLESNPRPAAVWARTLRIPPSSIRSYLSGLTTVVLRTDTQVTSYGLNGDRAIASQVVLQNGTSILVEPSGLPRVRCGSGNPLDQAKPLPSSAGTTPTYRGTPWSGFAPSTIIVIRPTRPIGAIIIVDLGRGVVIIRFPGDPGRDVEVAGLPPLLRPGDPVNVTGRGFPPGAVVTIRYDVPAEEMGTTTADGGGNVATQVPIPDDSGPGLHLVTAQGAGATNILPVYILPDP